MPPSEYSIEAIWTTRHAARRTVLSRAARVRDPLTATIGRMGRQVQIYWAPEDVAEFAAVAAQKFGAAPAQWPRDLRLTVRSIGNGHARYLDADGKAP